MVSPRLPPDLRRLLLEALPPRFPSRHDAERLLRRIGVRPDVIPPTNHPRDMWGRVLHELFARGLLPDLWEALKEDLPDDQVHRLDRLFLSLAAGPGSPVVRRKGLGPFRSADLEALAADDVQLDETHTRDVLGPIPSQAASPPPTREPRAPQEARGGASSASAARTRRSPAAARYLNAGVFSGDSEAPLPDSQPLALDGGPYRLGANVGPFWGPGLPGAPLPEQLLAKAFALEPLLELDVVAHSLDLRVHPARQTLRLAREGESNTVLFQLELLRSGRQAIDLDLVFRGHLLQSRRLELEVVERAGQAPPSSLHPPQWGYLTFSRVAALGGTALAPLQQKPSRLTLVAGRSLDGQRIALRIYDTAGIDLGIQETRLGEASLGAQLKRARQALENTMRAYAGGIGGGRPVRLARSLGALAGAGSSLFAELLPALAEWQEGRGDANARRLHEQLQPWTTVQVAPLSANLGVPWELLYERPIEPYDPRRIQLCTSFADHGPHPRDCPAAGNPRVVCPHGFWGYRYLIEQLPLRRGPGGSRPAQDLPLFIGRELPVELRLLVTSTLSGLEAHARALRALAPAERVRLSRVASLDEAETALGAPCDLLYAFTHGGTTEDSSPYLQVGSERLLLGHLRAWNVRLRGRPLALLNACGSGAYTPASFENLVQGLFDRGAAGVVGTQCPVPQRLARWVGERFLGQFLAQRPAGGVLLELRRQLLFEERDPRGLAYGLFAAAEVRLAMSAVA